MLSGQLQERDCKVLHASADAHVLLVRTTTRHANQQDKVLVEEEADLLALLCSQEIPPHPKSASDQSHKQIREPQYVNGIYIRSKRAKVGACVMGYSLHMPHLVGTQPPTLGFKHPNLSWKYVLALQTDYFMIKIYIYTHQKKFSNTSAC